MVRLIVLEIRNDATGTFERGNYDVSVLLPGVGWTHERIEDFDRSRGWAALAHEAIDRLGERCSATT